MKKSKIVLLTLLTSTIIASATILLAVVVALAGIATVGYTGYKIYVYLKSDKFQNLIQPRLNDEEKSNIVFSATEKLNYHYYTGDWPATNSQGMIPLGKDSQGNEIFAQPFKLREFKKPTNPNQE